MDEDVDTFVGVRDRRALLSRDRRDALPVVIFAGLSDEVGAGIIPRPVLITDRDTGAGIADNAAGADKFAAVTNGPVDKCVGAVANGA